MQDSEDYKQFEHVLKLCGYTETEAKEIVSKYQRFEESRDERLEDAIEAMNQMEVSKEQLGLGQVLFPESDELEDMPPYHRYVAFLVAQYNNEDAAKILGVSRMTLWNWLERRKELRSSATTCQEHTSGGSDES